MNPLIKSARGADFQSAQTQSVARTTSVGAAPALQDGVGGDAGGPGGAEGGGDSEGGDSGGDPDQPGPLAFRPAPKGHARDRAENGEEPDLEWAFDAMRKFTDLARRKAGGA